MADQCLNSRSAAYGLLQGSQLFPSRRLARTLRRPVCVCAVSAAVILLVILSAIPDSSDLHSRLSFRDALQRLHLPWPGFLLGEPWDVCVGANASLGEVEDFLCMPKPDYDRGMKNPCWWESNKTQSSGLQANATPTRSLSCLPYFHILCCSKSGTTDLFRRISIHPDIVPNSGIFGKEQLFWSWAKYGYVYRPRPQDGKPKPFKNYTHGFRNLATELEKAVRRNNRAQELCESRGGRPGLPVPNGPYGFCGRKVTFDASPPDMWDFRGWIKLPQNRNLHHPVVLTPHLMYHLYRDPKFIVLVREPVERLYTSYLFHREGNSAAAFHHDVLIATAMMEHCMATTKDRIECFFNENVTSQMPTAIHYSCYVVFFEEWLNVFPRKHFLFLRTEDYSDYPESSLLKVFSFLDLTPPSALALQRMLEVPIIYHTKQKDTAGPMLNETRDLLRKWFQPWNEQLARLLKDQRYLWLQ